MIYWDTLYSLLSSIRVYHLQLHRGAIWKGSKNGLFLCDIGLPDPFLICLPDDLIIIISFAPYMEIAELLTNCSSVLH